MVENDLKIYRNNRPIRRSIIVFPTLLLFIMAAGCATPTIKPADPQLLFQSDLFSFIRDGVTSREEALLKLGVPSAQIEGDRILMYQIRADKEGIWHLTAPNFNTTTGFRAWSEGTCSLVLVFGENGILSRHSLVTSK